MMLSEFEQRTGLYPTLVQYAAIERAYMEFDGDKDAFCKAYKKNANGIAERIQREVNLDTITLILSILVDTFNSKNVMRYAAGSKVA